MNLTDIKIFDGMDKMNFDDVAKMLSLASWSQGITVGEVKQGALNSALVVGAFYRDIQQVGYARVISDKTRFAYISDVYVDERFRKKGIALEMMNYILAHESLKDVYQWLLRSDADTLYEKVGFSSVTEPEKWMEIRNPRPDR